jgi:hypothetical protein
MDLVLMAFAYHQSQPACIDNTSLRFRKPFIGSNTQLNVFVCPFHEIFLFLNIFSGLQRQQMPRGFYRQRRFVLVVAQRKINSESNRPARTASLTGSWLGADRG